MASIVIAGFFSGRNGPGGPGKFLENTQARGEKNTRTPPLLSLTQVEPKLKQMARLSREDLQEWVQERLPHPSIIAVYWKDCGHCGQMADAIAAQLGKPEVADKIMQVQRRAGARGLQLRHVPNLLLIEQDETTPDVAGRFFPHVHVFGPGAGRRARPTERQGTPEDILELISTGTVATGSQPRDESPLFR